MQQASVQLRRVLNDCAGASVTRRVLNDCAGASVTRRLPHGKTDTSLTSPHGTIMPVLHGWAGCWAAWSCRLVQRVRVPGGRVGPAVSRVPAGPVLHGRAGCWAAAPVSSCRAGRPQHSRASLTWSGWGPSLASRGRVSTMCLRGRTAVYQRSALPLLASRASPTRRVMSEANGGATEANGVSNGRDPSWRRVSEGSQGFFPEWHPWSSATWWSEI